MKARLVWLLIAACAACSKTQPVASDADGSARDDASAEAAPNEPRKLADVPGDDPVTLHLYVSNQSSDPSLVDIRVALAGVDVVEGDFAVEGQHNWIDFDIRVPRGELALKATALSGAVVLEEGVDMPGERWAVLDFWHESHERDEPFLTWTLHDEPVQFE